MASTNFTDNVTVVAASWLDDVDKVAYAYLTGVAGTNTITATGPASLEAYAAGQEFVFLPANTNSGATTIAITGASALAAKNIYSGGAACVGGEIRANVPCRIHYDGTQFNIIGPYVGGNLPTGQIKFPATQNASTDANTLDDYEEGSWTPAVTFASAGDLSVAYTTQVGRYTKIGNLCVATFNIVTSSFTHTSATGNLRISGVPFTIENTTGLTPVGGLAWQGITKANYTDINAVAILNTTYLELQASGSAQNLDTIDVGDAPTGGSVILRGTVAFRV